MAIDTTVTDSFRATTQKNIDQLAARSESIRAQMRATEDEHRALLAEALAPLEAALQDTNAALYSQERTLGALPAVQPRFSEQRDGAADPSRPGEESSQGEEDVGRGLSESQANG